MFKMKKKKFPYYCEEINFALINLKDELNKFSFYLDDLLTTLFFFSQKIIEEIFFFSEEYQENMNKIKRTFKVDLKNQLEELASVIFVK